VPEHDDDVIVSLSRFGQPSLWFGAALAFRSNTNPLVKIIQGVF
jgi:hypothetical protein